MARETDLTYYVINKIKMAGFCTLIKTSAGSIFKLLNHKI